MRIRKLCFITDEETKKKKESKYTVDCETRESREEERRGRREDHEEIFVEDGMKISELMEE